MLPHTLFDVWHVGYDAYVEIFNGLAKGHSDVFSIDTHTFLRSISKDFDTLVILAYEKKNE